MGLTQAEHDAVERKLALIEPMQRETTFVALVRESAKMYQRHELLAKYVKALGVIEEFLGDCAASGVNPAIVWPAVSTETNRYKAVVTIIPLNGGDNEEG